MRQPIRQPIGYLGVFLKNRLKLFKKSLKYLFHTPNRHKKSRQTLGLTAFCGFCGSMLSYNGSCCI